MRLSSCLDLCLRRRREKERESERGEREGERGGKREREERERERGKETKEFKCGEGGTLCIETFCVRGGERLCQLCLKRQPVSS